jgi:RimJ/RimL family protein N-acetyltransferase
VIGTLRTPRLLLRPLTAGDEALYVHLYTDAQTLHQVGPPQSAVAARRGFAAALRDQATGLPRRPFWVMQHEVDGAIGLIGLSRDDDGGAELGVVLPVACQGRGYATEAIAALAAHAFSRLGLSNLHTRHAAGHGLAAGLMSGLDFAREADIPGDFPARWRLSAEVWRKRQ